MRRIHLRWLIFLVFPFFLTSCDEITNPDVSKVKNATLSSHPGKTIGEAASSFMGLPRWEGGVSDKGKHFVNVRGKIKFMEKDVEAVLQFTLDSDAGTFQATALEFNGIPQNQLIMNALIQKMYE